MFDSQDHEKRVAVKGSGGKTKEILTLVLRSTHSSQLNVGLLRFCLGFARSPSGVSVRES